MLVAKPIGQHAVRPMGVVQPAARANKFAATTTRNPPSRIGGPGVRASEVHARARTVRIQERMNSPLEEREIRLRGL
jgi:hypothetical protein